MPTCSDAEFISLFESRGPSHAARTLGIAVRNVHTRRKNIEKRIGRPLYSPIGPGNIIKEAPGRGTHRLEWKIPNGEIIVGSDAHVWPGSESPMMRAFIEFAKRPETKGVIANGDIFDGAKISRHAQIMWEKSPNVIQELEAAQDWLNRLVQATRRGVPMAWPQGNHDARFETRLSSAAPEFANVKGVHLKDHFSNRLQPCWSVWINDSVVIKHRARGGDHAAWNNTIRSGKSIVTGHLHSAKVVPFDDYNGTRWGVDCGCLADPHGPQFLAYTEDGFRNHRAGFCVLTFRNGVLMQPELVLSWDDKHIQFRGQLIKV